MAMTRNALRFVFAGVVAAWAQPPAAAETVRRIVFETRPSVILSNGVLELTVALEGGAFVRLILKDDPEEMSPLWNPMRAAREAGAPPPQSASFGHFVCVDGFGVPSGEEQAAGLPAHGEAYQQLWELVRAEMKGGTATLEMRTRLLLTQETFTRTVHMPRAESVVYVESQLESWVGFDRPIEWSEHATLGAPFLEHGSTFVDLSVKRATTRPYDESVDARNGIRHRITSGEEFTWPNAPARNGGTVDMRGVPDTPPSSEDQFSVVLGSAHPLAFVTALNLRRHLVFGYLVRPADYPWLQNWESYSDKITMARGLEFATQPYGMPRRQIVGLYRLLDVPTFRWLPAKSKIETRFLLFYAKTPEQFRRLDDARLENGLILLEDNSTGSRMQIRASLAGDFLRQ